jgi:hypothetical protein
MAKTKAATAAAARATAPSSALEELAKTASKPTRERFAEQAKEGVVNPIVLAALLGVRPQMIYNYLRKGKFSEVEGAVGQNSTQKKVIRLDEANAFAQQYSTRKIERETKAAEKVKAELSS